MAYETPSAVDHVVEWGTGDPEPRRPRWSGLPAAVGIRERHLIVSALVIGGALALVALLSTWQVTRMPDELPERQTEVQTGVAGLEAWGSGYLLGLLGLLALTAAATYGAPRVRRQLRLAGLGWAAGMLALLVAIAVDLGRTSILLRYSYITSTSVPQPELSYGPGIYLAFVSTAMFGAILYLSGRLPDGPPGESFAGSPGDPGTERAATQVAVPEPADGGGGDADTPMPSRVGGPIDLTVRPAPPFSPLRQPGEWR